MKKTFYLVTILFGIIISSLMFNDFNMWSREKSRHLNIVNVEEGTEVDLDLNVVSSAFGKTNEELFDTTISFLEKNNLNGYIILYTNEKDSTHTKSYFYLTNNHDYFKYISVRNVKSMDEVFSESDWLITNDINQEEGYLIDFIDNDRYKFDGTINFEIEMRSLASIYETFPETDDQILIKISVPTELEEFYFEKMEAHFEEFIPKNSHGILVSDKSMYEYYYPKVSLLSSFTLLPYSIIWVSLFLTLFLSIYVSINSTKDMIVGYLNGYSIFTILKDFYLKTIVVSSTLFIISIFVTSWILSASHQLAYLRFISSFIQIVIIYLILMILSSILSFIYLKHKFSSETLKETHQIKISFWLTNLLKIILIILVAIPLIEASTMVMRRKSYLDKVRENIGLVNSKYINHISENIDQPQYDEVIKYINGLVYKQNIHYLNAIENLIKDIEDDLFYTMSNIILKTNDDFATVNNVFLEQSIGLNTQSNDLDEIYMLVSKHHNIEELKSLNPNINIFEYDIDVDIIPMFSESYKENMGILNNPIIIVDNNAVKKNPGYIDRSIIDYNNEFNLKEKLSEIEKEYSLDFSVVSFEGQIRYVTRDYLEDLSLIRGLSLMLFLVLPVFVYTSIQLFMKSQSKELVIKYMNGYSYLQRYGSLILSVLSSSVLSFIGIFFIVKNLENINMIVLNILMGLIFVIDLVMIAYGIRRYEKNNMPQVLKGEN